MVDNVDFAHGHGEREWFAGVGVATVQQVVGGSAVGDVDGRAPSASEFVVVAELVQQPAGLGAGAVAAGQHSGDGDGLGGFPGAVECRPCGGVPEDPGQHRIGLSQFRPRGAEELVAGQDMVQGMGSGTNLMARVSRDQGVPHARRASPIIEI